MNMKCHMNPLGMTCLHLATTCLNLPLIKVKDLFIFFNFNFKLLFKNLYILNGKYFVE